MFVGIFDSSELFRVVINGGVVFLEKRVEVANGNVAEM